MAGTNLEFPGAFMHWLIYIYNNLIILVFTLKKRVVMITLLAAQRNIVEHFAFILLQDWKGKS
jgi:hypothetical protein